MYLLYAPKEKFGILPPGHPLITEDVRFYMNVAFCPKFYWQKVHTQNGCRDISPRLFKKLRNKRELNTILIFATGGIGDSMWLMPFARAMKERRPTATILIVVETRNAPIWLYVPYVNATVEDNLWNMIGLMRSSDEVYDFGGMATFLKEFMRLDPVEATFQMAGYDRPKEREKMRPKLVVTIDEGKRCQARLKDKGINTKENTIITIAVESSTANRNWPFEYVKDLSKALIGGGYKVIWIGESKEYSEKFLDAETNAIGALNLIGQTGLRDIMALISLSDLVITPNTSPIVIATSLQIPTIGLFGAFSWKLRAKYYDRFIPLQGKVPCGPCGEHWTECRNGHPAPCMKSILPSTVYEASIYALKKWPRSLIEKLPIE